MVERDLQAPEYVLQKTSSSKCDCGEYLHLLCEKGPEVWSCYNNAAMTIIGVTSVMPVGMINPSDTASMPGFFICWHCKRVFQVGYRVYQPLLKELKSEVEHTEP